MRCGAGKTATWRILPPRRPFWAVSRLELSPIQLLLADPARLTATTKPALGGIAKHLKIGCHTDSSRSAATTTRNQACVPTKRERRMGAEPALELTTTSTRSSKRTNSTTWDLLPCDSKA